MNAPDRVGEVVLQRVYSEFLEMPGLRLTIEQAQRLWGLDAHTCRRLMEFLVDVKFLSQRRDGIYSRLSDGQMDGPRPRMAKAEIGGSTPEKKEHVR